MKTRSTQQVTESPGDEVPVGGLGQCERDAVVFGDPVVAPDPGDLLDQIDFPGQVPPPSRYGECGGGVIRELMDLLKVDVDL